MDVAKGAQKNAATTYDARLRHSAAPVLRCSAPVRARAAGGATRSHAEACGVAALVAGQQSDYRRVAQPHACPRLRLALTRARRRCCCQSLRTTWASGTRRSRSSSSRLQKGRRRRRRSMLHSQPTARSCRSTFAARCWASSSACAPARLAQQCPPRPRRRHREATQSTQRWQCQTAGTARRS